MPEPVAAAEPAWHVKQFEDAAEFKVPEKKPAVQPTHAEPPVVLRKKPTGQPVQAARPAAPA